MGAGGAGRRGGVEGRLVVPTVAYRDTFLEGAAEYFGQGRPDPTYALALGHDLASLGADFARFVADLVALGTPPADGSRRQADRVLWLLDGSQYIGEVSVRPELATEYLFTYGGHIGYSIRPSRRGHGYGTRILAATLPVARRLGLGRVLVTCDADNEASRRIIERNGGRFECALPMPRRVLQLEGRDPGQRLDKLRFWIDLQALEPGAPGLAAPHGNRAQR
jgi:predicted acetyltransferase